MSQNVSALENLKSTFDNLTAEERLVFMENAEDGIVILDNIDVADEEKAAIYAAIQDPANQVFAQDSETLAWSMSINDAADAVFHDLAGSNLRARIILRLAITVLPVALIGAAFIVLKKKFIIDEKYYEEITAGQTKEASTVA